MKAQLSKEARRSFIHYRLKRSCDECDDGGPVVCVDFCNLLRRIVSIFGLANKPQGEIVGEGRHSVNGVVSFECDATCAICWEGFKGDLTLLPCGHVWHTSCIEKWVSDHHKCPSCRQDLNRIAKKLHEKGARHSKVPVGRGRCLSAAIAGREAYAWGPAA